MLPCSIPGASSRTTMLETFLLLPSPLTVRSGSYRIHSMFWSPWRLAVGGLTEEDRGIQPLSGSWRYRWEHFVVHTLELGAVQTEKLLSSGGWTLFQHFKRSQRCLPITMQSAFQQRDWIVDTNSFSAGFSPPLIQDLPVLLFIGVCRFALWLATGHMLIKIFVLWPERATQLIHSKLTSDSPPHILIKYLSPFLLI